eukprot:scaffold358_cov256-Pinguiococcus_pyrenoidosus.AAC.4
MNRKALARRSLQSSGPRSSITTPQLDRGRARDPERKHPGEPRWHTYLPDEGEPVAVDAAGCQPDQLVSRLHVLGQRRSPLHRTDREPRKVIVAVVVHAGHFRRLPPDQAAVGLLAAGGDAPHDLRGALDFQRPRGVVVQEEQRLRAGYHEVVHAHRNQIDAHVVMHTRRLRHAQLGADPVGRPDENRIFAAIAGCVQVEEAAEATEIGIASWSPSSLARWLDPLHQEVPSIDVDASVLVAKADRSCSRFAGAGADISHSKLLNGLHESAALQRLHLLLQGLGRLARLY